MYKVIEEEKRGISYYTITKVDSPMYGVTIAIDMEHATQEELKYLFDAGHPFVKDDKKVKASE
jgi:hypothetical protein